MTTRIVTSCVVIALGATVLTGDSGRASEPAGPGVTAEQAVQRLHDGNARFAAGRSTPEHEGAERREAVAQGQSPLAIVLGCSDSRVGPEVVFDQGLGDVFVIRTAGHVVDDVALGSIEYAAEHLGTPLLMVLGHERCGAVSAAVAGGEVHGHLAAVLKAIEPAVHEARNIPGDTVDNAVRANVRLVTRQLETSAPILASLVKAGRLKVVGARYDLDTGKVELLDRP